MDYKMGPSPIFRRLKRIAISKNATNPNNDGRAQSGFLLIPKIFKKMKFWLKKQAKKEIMLFPKSDCPFCFKPFFVYQGVVVLALILIVGHIFIFKPAVDEAVVIGNAVLKPVSAVVAGQPIKYTLLVKKSDITSGQYLAKLPKGAESIQVNNILKKTAQNILNQTAPKNTLTTAERKILAERIKPRPFLASLVDGVKFLFADLEQAVSQIINKVAEKDSSSTKISKTSDAVYVNLLSEAKPEQEYIAINYEIEPTDIKEEKTDTGKLVTVSSEDQPVQPKLTDVVAFSVIPEIYKVGQEDKIKIKWQNNGNQAVTFNAYDLDGNNKLDYVEWTVPHLSTQTFEIILISKAWKLDQYREATEDVYGYVEKEDNNWTTINNGEYIRVTFKKELLSKNDITIHAKPTNPAVAPIIQVYTKDSNNLIVQFPAISKEKTYKVFLSNLLNKTDTFDLKVIGGSVDFDYIVDPTGWLSGYGLRKEIIISGTNVDAELTDFPLLVKFANDMDIGSATQADGDDVVFTDSDGTTLLKFEKNSWSKNIDGAATGSFWVKIPTINASPGDTTIYMYYSNESAVNTEDPTNVWESNFAGVWHFDDNAPTAYDATINANNGTVGGNAAVSFGQTGKVDKAVYFAGSDDYIEVPYDSSYDAVSSLTVSGWVNFSDSTTNTSPLVSRDNYHFDTELPRMWKMGGDQTGNLFYEIFGDDSGYINPSGTGFDLSTWYYVTMTYEVNESRSFYLNGVEKHNVGVTGYLNNSSSVPLRFGAAENDGTESLNGYGDEIRISSVARSAAWVKFEYFNMAEGSISFGEESVPTEICNDEFDNDGDGDVDCNDADCSGDEGCQGGPCPDATCEREEICAEDCTYEVYCDDNVDNDNDGSEDCNDGDCSESESCVPQTESDCGDSIDNDSDSYTDCDDSECVEDPACVAACGNSSCDYPENCNTCSTDCGSCGGVSPSISFSGSTPSSNSCQESTSATISITSSDTNGHSVAINFDNSLINWWRMDDLSSGNPTDYIGDNDGTANYGAAQISGGQFGKAFAFDGTEDYITAPDTGIPTGGNNRTVSAWFKPSGVSGAQAIFSHGEATADSDFYAIMINTNICIGSMDGGDICGSTTLGTDIWYHVVLSYDGIDARLYLNGSLEATATSRGYDTVSNETFMIGATSGSGDFFGGLIDDVQVYNRALSSAEILSLYNAGTNQYSRVFSDLSLANYTFNAYAQDPQGNITAAGARTFEVSASCDITPPVPSDFSPASGSTISDATQTITFTTDENATCKVSLTDQAYGDMTGDACTGGGTTSQSCTTPDLGSDGSKNVYIACTDGTNADTAGTNENLTYTLDATAPTVNAGADQTQSAQFTQTGTASDNSEISTYAWSMVSGPGTISFGSANAVATTISASEAGTYVIRLTVVDALENSGYDEFTLVWSEATPAPQEETESTATPSIGSKIVVPEQFRTNQLTIIQTQLNNLTQQVSELFGASEQQINYPPIEESVTEEAPIALQGWDIMEIKPVSELLLYPMDSSLGFFASKIPQFSNTLVAFGIDTKNPADAGKIGEAQLYLPGLTQTLLAGAELPLNPLAMAQGVPVADLSIDALKNIPTDIVFARSAGELLDYSMAILVDKNGDVEQKLETIAGKKMDLVIKPEEPAKRVTGYITLKKSGLGQGEDRVLGYITRLLTASLLSSIDKTGSDMLNGEGLLLNKFSYEETAPGVFKASVSAPENEGEYAINTVIEYQDVSLAPKETKMTAIVNPEGYIYADNPDGRLRIKNASVSLYWLNPETEEYELWPADKFLQQNPIITNETGRYSFLVPEGTYKIKAEAKNYSSYESEPFAMKESIAVSRDIRLQKNAGIISMPTLQMWQYIIILLSVLIIIFVIIMFIKGRHQ